MFYWSFTSVVVFGQPEFIILATPMGLIIRAIPECFSGGDSRRRGAISSVCTFTFTLLFRPTLAVTTTFIREILLDGIQL